MTKTAFKLRNSHRPELTSGTYALSVRQNGKLSGEGTERSLAEATFSFEMSQSMSGLAPADIVTQYPADGASAPFDHVIPHIVLKNSMLPWMDAMPADENKPMPPCLALILLRPQDVFSFADDETAPDHARIRRLVLKDTLFRAIRPALSDLHKLAHVRVLSHAEYAVLLANRLPASGGMNTLCLVRLTDTYGTAAQTDISLPCLATWRFRCTAGQNHFHAVFGAENLSVGRLLPPLPAPCDDPWYEIAKDKLSNGYVPLAHHTAQGDDTISWYHGPLVPGPDVPDASLQQNDRYHPENKDFRLALESSGNFIQMLPDLTDRRHPTVEDETGDFSLTYFRTMETGGPPTLHGSDRFRLRLKRDRLYEYIRNFPAIKKPLADIIDNRLPETIHAWLGWENAQELLVALDEATNPTSGLRLRFFLAPEMHLGSDALTRLDPATQLQDVSHAVAWQIGRLLGLADGTYRRAVMNWRRGCADADADSDSAAGCAHLCCAMPENDDVFPMEVGAFLTRLSQLQSVPPAYLLPTETMLAPSTLRTFVIDPLWVYRLLQGALSIGSEACPCETAESRALKRLATLARVEPDTEPQAGIVIRSEAISTWPGLSVRFFDTEGEIVSQPASAPCKPMPDVLLALSQRPFASAELSLPEEHPHFEFARRHMDTPDTDPTESSISGFGRRKAGTTPVVRFVQRARIPSFESEMFQHATSPAFDVWDPEMPTGHPPFEGPHTGSPSTNADPLLPDEGDIPAKLPDDGFWLKDTPFEDGVEIAQHFQIGAHSVQITFVKDDT